MQRGVAPAGRYSARNVGGQFPSNASPSAASAMKSLNWAESRSILKSPQTTAGAGIPPMTRDKPASWAR
jgi:hypothetical protein